MAFVGVEYFVDENGWLHVVKRNAKGRIEEDRVFRKFQRFFVTYDMSVGDNIVVEVK